MLAYHFLLTTIKLKLNAEKFISQVDPAGRHIAKQSQQR